MAGEEDTTASAESERLILTVAIPYADDLQMDFNVSLNDCVYDLKQTVLHEFNKIKLKDPLNFGFYQLPHNGRAGKFLEEERRLCEYASIRTDPYLEFRFKRRIYRSLHLDERKLHKVNTKTNQKKFLEFLIQGNAEKMKLLLERGLDPNFHEEKTGETPLSLLVIHSYHGELLKAIIAYGGFVDFRCLNGETALHRATLLGNDKALQCLLDLGASPNLKDSKGLTPLYQGITHGSSSNCCELLLKEHTQLEIADHQGFHEIHHACRSGLVKHLNQLIVYGADLNSRTLSGNTPLHIAAIWSQLDIIRVLLSCGADKTLGNYANQTCYEVAIIAGNKDAANLIQTTNYDTIEPITPSQYKERRGTVANLAVRTANHQPLPRCYSECNMSKLPPNQLRAPIGYNDRQTSFPTDQNYDSAMSDSCDSDDDNSGQVKKNQQRSVHDGLGAKRELPPMKISRSGSVSSRIKERPDNPFRRYLVVNDYAATGPGELELQRGDIIEVINMRQQGFWEGRIHGRTGWFPSQCVQEVKKLKKQRPKTWFGRKPTSADGMFSPSTDCPSARVVTLKRCDKGFGFQLRGANSHVPRIAFTPTPQYPALQYIGEIDKGGLADKSGVRPGDFILEINGDNVINATHTYAVSLINKNSKHGVTLKLVTIEPVTSDWDTVSLSSQSDIQPMRSGSFSKNLKGFANTVAGKKKGRKQPPKPPPRGHYGTLGARPAFSGSCTSLLTEVPVTPNNNVDTMIMYSNRDGSSSTTVRSMWSESAFKLRGPSTEQPQSQRRTSHDGNSLTIGPEAMEHYATLPRNHKHPPKEQLPIDQNKDTQRRPPGYQYALENLRRQESQVATSNEQAARQRTRPVSMFVDGANTHVEGRKSSLTEMTSSHQHEATVKYDRSISEGGAPAVNSLDTLLRDAIEKRKAKAARQAHQSIDENRPIEATPVLPSNGTQPTNRSPNRQQNEPNGIGMTTRRDSKGSDYFSLYEASSSASLDSQCSKDSGVETSSQSEGVDHEKALLNAIAARQSRMTQQQQQPQSEVHAVKMPPVIKPKPVSVSSHRKSTTSDLGNELLLSTVAVNRPNASPIISDVDRATRYFDSVIADAEKSIDGDTVSLTSSPSLTGSEIVSTTVTDTVIAPPPMFDDEDVLPPPPIEFLDGNLVIQTESQPSKQIQTPRPDQHISLDPPPYSPPRPPTSDVAYKGWSCLQVSDWLESLSLGQYKSTFIDNDIRGSHLSELTKDDLAELGVKKLGHRLTLDDAIGKLCRH